MSNEDSIFDLIAGNTIAVITRLFDKRAEWRANLLEIQEQAEAEHDLEMLTLLESVISLVNGSDLAQLNPELTDIYKECWDYISENIRWQQNPVVIAVQDFLNAKTWQGSKDIAERQRQYLLTDEAQELVEDIIEKYKDTPSISRLENFAKY